MNNYRVYRVKAGYGPGYNLLIAVRVLSTPPLFLICVNGVCTKISSSMSQTVLFTV